MKITIIFGFILLGINNGCVSTETAYSMGGATLGGLSGALVSAKNPTLLPFVSGGGAAVGGLMGSMLARSVKSGSYAMYKEGYQQGASDAVKRQYWILQNLQKERYQQEKWASYKLPIEFTANAPYPVSRGMSISTSK